MVYSGTEYVEHSSHGESVGEMLQPDYKQVLLCTLRKSGPVSEREPMKVCKQKNFTSISVCSLVTMRRIAQKKPGQDLGGS